MSQRNRRIAIIICCISILPMAASLIAGVLRETPLSIDVAAPAPRYDAEFIELNPDVGLESGSRQDVYRLESLPDKSPLPVLEFVNNSAKITARDGQAGMLTCPIPVDKGQLMNFSVRVRGTDVGSVQLVVVSRPRNARSAPPRRPQGAQNARPPQPRPATGQQGPRSGNMSRSEPLSGSFDWTTLRIETSFTGNIDRATMQVVIQGSGTVWVDDVSAKVLWPKVLDIPDKPAAPLLLMVLMHSETPQAYIQNREYFAGDAGKYEEMARMLHRYGGRLVIEPERQIWQGADKYDPDWIRRLHDKYGASFSVHTHGPNPRDNPTDQDVLDYVKLRKDEMEARGAGPVTDLNGNFDQLYWDMFGAIGISTMTAYKNVRTQRGQDAMDHCYRHPWRPAGSPYQSEKQWAQHSPESRVVYIPGGGAIHTVHHDRLVDLMNRHLRVALNQVRSDRVNVWYMVEHVGRFKTKVQGQSNIDYVNSQAFRDDFAPHDAFHRDVISPLVKSGHIRYVIPSEIGDAFEAWERKTGIFAQQ